MGIETSFDIISEGNTFPTVDMSKRNAKYTLNYKRYNGSYADNKYLVVLDNNGNQKKIMWQQLKLNKFKLYTNKMVSLIFNRDPIIKTGDTFRDREVNKLIDRTHWLDGIRQAIKNMEIYGDSPIKTYSNGVSAFSPINCFKVVDENDKDNVIAYVLVDYIKDKYNVRTHIRFESHLDGFVYERVYKYNGTSLGKPVRYKYKNRIIPVSGNTFKTDVDINMIQWLSCDKCEEGVYGQSPYEDFACLVHEAERRQTLNIKILDAHSEPMLAVGMGMLRENEVTGKVEAFDVLGNIVEIPNGQNKPEYITWDGKLDSSEKMLDLLFSEIYEMTELGKTFMTGEYTGSISDDTINDLVKSATDRANRHVWDIYYEVRKSLYVLCKLNDINISIDELNITFQVGQTDGIKTVAEVFNSRVEKGTISVVSGLQEYFGLTEDEAKEELKRIREEKGATQ